MTMAEIYPNLVSRGIRDLTEDIELTSTSPFASGGFADLYEGGLRTTREPRHRNPRGDTDYTQGNSTKPISEQFPSNASRMFQIRSSRPQVAIKIRRSNPDSAGYHWRIASSIYNWSKCQHPNVVELLGFVTIDDRIGLVLPWVENGTVMSYIKAFPDCHPRKKTGFCVQISEGVSYLHSVGIVHGDIKGDNVLVSKEGNAMLTDFDESELGERSLIFTGKVGGSGVSLRWTAPELLLDAGSAKKTCYSDVYALGMTILEVLSGNPPRFMTDSVARMAVLISRGRHPTRPFLFSNKYGDYLWDLLVECWQYGPQTRPSASYVLEFMKTLSPRDLKSPCAPPCPPRTPPIPHWPRGAISRHMQLEDVVSHLVSRGCANISESIHESTFSAMPSLYGGSSDVYRGNLFDSTAVCVKVPRFTRDTAEAVKSRVYVSREIHTWNKCKHPNILPFLGLAVFRDRLAVVSPWIKNGPVQNYLMQNPDADRCRLSAQICAGLTYLHDIDVVHGDLKGDNVLISDDGNALLTDFGSADIKDRTITFTQLMDQCGWTMRWAAPELLQETVLRSKESDVYALGMTILELITGQLPFSDKQEMAVMLAVCFKKEVPARPMAYIPANSQHGLRLWGILRKCWSHEPEKRPTAFKVGFVMETIRKEDLLPFEEDDDWELL